jgi:hypothetical protein
MVTMFFRTLMTYEFNLSRVIDSVIFRVRGYGCVFVYLGGNFSPLEPTELKIDFRFTSFSLSSSQERIKLVRRGVLGTVVFPAWRGTRERQK